MDINNIASKQVLNSIKLAAKLRNQYIQRHAFDVILYKSHAPKVLTEFGEPSYYATRETKVIKLLPSLKTKYSLLSFSSPGVVNEQDSNKVYDAFIRSDEEVSKGDVIKISYKYDNDIIDVKYYQIKKIIISALIENYSKMIILQPYVLPMEVSELSNSLSDYQGITPDNTFI